MPVHSGSTHGERTRAFADRFLEEMRQDVRRAVAAGSDILPRLRCVHERQGHATPEFRTLMIPKPPGGHTLSPELISRAIACFAARRPAERLVLAMDAVQGDAAGGQPVLIAEARDAAGTRLFWMQPYRADGPDVVWAEPLAGGWINPGEEEMILDAAFSPPAARRTGTSP